MSSNFSDYYFRVVPVPVLRCRKLTRLEKQVAGDLYSRYLMARENPVSVSIRSVARNVSCKWEHARDAVEKLRRLGVVEGPNESVRVVCPDWMSVDSDDLRRPDSSPLGGEGYAPREESPPLPREGSPPLPREGSPPLPREGSPPLPRGGINRSGIDPERDQKTTGGSEDPPGDITTRSKSSREDLRGSEDEGGEEEEPNLNGDSKTAASVIAASKDRPKRKPKVKRIAKSTDDGYLDRPSLRPDFAEGKKLRTSGIALIGHWARKYREKIGVEDEQLRFLGAESAPCRILASNVGKFVSTFLDGDWDRAYAAVDAILRDAKGLGYPVSLRYFFTPAKDGAMRAILDKRRRDGRALAPYEIDNMSGSDPKNFQRDVDAFMSRRGRATT